MLGSAARSLQPSGRPTDSAYNSEHEHTPEEQDNSKASEEEEPTEEKEEEEEEGIRVKLQEANLWKSFHKVGNEMIVTKPGR